MKKRIVFLIAGLLISSLVQANDVEIVKVHMTAANGDRWKADVTLKHDDTSWEHYADAWRIMTEDGKLLGTRVLFHPHIDEQPFTRSLTLSIPANITVIRVEAHDKVHGWAKQFVRVDLNTAAGDRYTVSK